ncbi:MAG: STN domain-containing protein [Bacteroidales bacterium]|nr:STN domain-containing protein [Bacteroidales bacterium]
MRRLHYLVFTLAAMMFICNLSASVLDKTLNVSFVNISLLDALSQIEKQANITFSFKSSDISQKKIISLQAKNITIAKVLEQLLGGQNVGYRAIGTQIILYKLAQAKNLENSEINKVATVHIDTIHQIVTDTVQITDTVRITLYDSVQIKIYDTVRTVLPIEPNSSNKKSAYFTELQYCLLRGGKPSTVITDNPTLVETVAYSQSLTIFAGIKKGFWGIKTGIGFGSETKELEYSQLTFDTTIIKIPQIEDYIGYDSMYYILKPIDTVWTITPVVKQRTVFTDSFVLDSSYQKQKTAQAIRSIQVPISLSFFVVEKANWNVFVDAGLVFNFVRFKDAEFRNADKSIIKELQEVNLAPISCTFQGSVGMSIQLLKQLFLSISPSISYKISNNYYSYNNIITKPFRYGIEVSLKKYIK